MNKCGSCDASVSPGESRCRRCGAKVAQVDNAALLAMLAGVEAGESEAELTSDAPDQTGPVPVDLDLLVVAERHVESPVIEPSPVVEHPPVENERPSTSEPEIVRADPVDLSSQKPNGHLTGIDLIEKLATGCRRDDLLARVQQAREILSNAEARVVLTGEYKHGKSSLVNAILGTAVCPVDGVNATTIPTILRYGETLSAAWVGLDQTAEDIPTPIDTEAALREAILEGGRKGLDSSAAAVEIRLPRRLLAAGLSIIDTPGVGGLSSPEAAVAAAMAQSADAVLFVSDLTQELTAPELEYLKAVAAKTPNIICVFTKADLTVSGAAIVDRNRLHLENAGLGHLPHAVVSSVLHAFALEHQDAELETESGFGALFDLIRRRALDRAQTRVAKTARAELELISAQLELEADATQRAADGQAHEVSAELSDAKERTVRARGDEAQWRKELTLGIKNLQSDAQRDRQKRRLAINRWVENVLAEEGSEPKEAELGDDDFIDLLHRKVLDASADHFEAVQELIDELAEKVHALYAAESADVIDVRVDHGYLPVNDHLTPVRKPVSTSRSRSLLAVAQSSSSGMMVASTAVGVSTTSLTLIGAQVATAVLVLGPLILGAPIGVMFAMRAIRDDRKRQRDLNIHELRKRASTYMQEAWLDFDHESRRAIDEAQTLLRETIEFRSRQIEQTLKHAAAAAERIGRARDAGQLEEGLSAKIGKGREALEAMRINNDLAVAERVLV